MNNKEAENGTTFSLYISKTDISSSSSRISRKTYTRDVNRGVTRLWQLEIFYE